MDLGSMDRAEGPRDQVGLDFIGHVDDTHVLVMVNYLSRRVKLERCEFAYGAHVIRGSEGLLRARGGIQQIVTDGGNVYKR